MTLNEMIEARGRKNDFNNVIEALYKKLKLSLDEMLHKYYSIEDIAAAIFYEMITVEKYSADDIRRSIIMERLLRSINGAINNKIVDEILNLCDVEIEAAKQRLIDEIDSLDFGKH